MKVLRRILCVLVFLIGGVLVGIAMIFTPIIYIITGNTNFVADVIEWNDDIIDKVNPDK